MRGLGILCPGQGNQSVEMFEKLPGSPAAEAVMRAATKVFGCHPIEYIHQLSAQELFSNRFAQPLIGVLQMATWAELQCLLPQPRIFAGYSVGEIIAYGCAGSLSIDETLKVIEQRAAMMDEASTSATGMVAIRGLDRQQVEKLCLDTGAEIAIINSSDHFVIGGHEYALAGCQSHPLAKRATTLKQLQINVPSHTSLLAGVGPPFEVVLLDSSLKDPIVPVLAGVSGSIVRSREQAIGSLVKQLSSPVNWLACMQTAVEMGCKVFLELGPGDALAKMMREAFPLVTARSVSEFRSLDGVASWVTKQCASDE
jgi:[acyl-carrier-protein] S-malonyltransferase